MTVDLVWHEILVGCHFKAASYDICFLCRIIATFSMILCLRRNSHFLQISLVSFPELSGSQIDIDKPVASECLKFCRNIGQ